MGICNKTAGLAALVLVSAVLHLSGCSGGGIGTGSSSSGGSSSSSSSSSGGTSSSGSGSAGVSVLTYHNDNARTGQNLHETVLSQGRVNAASFGKLGFLAVQGKVDAEPLYVPRLQIQGAAHNVVFVVTEHDLAYAFDADSFGQLWQASLLGAGESPSDDRSCAQITPEIGATATPVIDPVAGVHGALYLVAMARDGSGHYHQRLHALDLVSGAELPGSPVEIQASFSNLAGHTTFDPGQYAERAGLLLQNGTLYLAWTSHCDNDPYTGWIMAYDSTSLRQRSVLDITPNGSEGSVWMSGAGLAADAAGYIYLLSANGTFDTQLDRHGFPGQGDFGNAFLKLSIGGGLVVADYFAMYNTVAESNADEDLGSGGVLVLPDLVDGNGVIRHLAAGAGKDGTVYLVNRDNMGKFNPNTNAAIYQQFGPGVGALAASVYGMPAYYNSALYYGAVDDNLKSFPLIHAQLQPASSQSAVSFSYPGTMPSISANGSADAIVWAVENDNFGIGNGPTNGILHAYDAANLSHELYNSNQASGARDQFADNKFITPMITGGKVYVGTPTGVAVFGLLN